jgi:hypothetical protein
MVLIQKSIIQDNAVEIAAPLAPNTGISIKFPIILTTAQIVIAIRLNMVFFFKSMPMAVVDEMVYANGTNNRYINIMDISLYAGPKKSIMTSRKTISIQKTKLIKANKQVFTLSNFSTVVFNSYHL